MIFLTICLVDYDVCLAYMLKVIINNNTSLCCIYIICKRLKKVKINCILKRVYITIVFGLYFDDDFLWGGGGFRVFLNYFILSYLKSTIFMNIGRLDLNIYWHYRTKILSRSKLIYPDHFEVPPPPDHLHPAGKNT